MPLKDPINFFCFVDCKISFYIVKEVLSTFVFCVYATTTSTGEKAGAGGFSGAAFTIESKTGQLRVKAMEALNFEMVREFTIRVIIK